MLFPIALDMLLCVVPNRHSHCSQALHHASPRPWSSSTHVDVQMGLGPVASQSLLSSFPPCLSKEVFALFFDSLITNLSSGGTRCNDLAFWTIFREKNVFVCHWRCANPDCLSARMCTCLPLVLRMATLGFVYALPNTRTNAVLPSFFT